MRFLQSLKREKERGRAGHALPPLVPLLCSDALLLLLHQYIILRASYTLPSLGSRLGLRVLEPRCEAPRRRLARYASDGCALLSQPPLLDLTLFSFSPGYSLEELLSGTSDPKMQQGLRETKAVKLLNVCLFPPKICLG